MKRHIDEGGVDKLHGNMKNTIRWQPQGRPPPPGGRTMADEIQDAHDAERAVSDVDDVVPSVDPGTPAGPVLRGDPAVEHSSNAPGTPLLEGDPDHDADVKIPEDVETETVESFTAPPLVFDQNNVVASRNDGFFGTPTQPGHSPKDSNSNQFYERNEPHPDGATARPASPEAVGQVHETYEYTDTWAEGTNPKDVEAALLAGALAEAEVVPDAGAEASDEAAAPSDEEHV